MATHVAAAAGGAALLGLVLWLPDPLTRPMRRPRDPVRTPPTSYDWTEQPAPAFPIPPYARHLKGVKIVLDPGHGGRGDRPNWKRGPTGLREAEINLSVAQFLRGFLATGGAQVVMTRESDEYLHADISTDTSLRIARANQLGADLFLSIHHNASQRPGVNYTSIFYHGTPEQSPAGRCAARYLVAGLNDALRLDQHLPCAMLSDRLLFDNGLRVLREARVPAVLSEASFHSDPEEERRLRDPLYNRREAYGHFLGLARWAQAGLPRIRLVQPTGQTVRAGETLVVALDDGLSARGGWGSDSVRISAESLVVKLDGKPVSFAADLQNKQLRLQLPIRAATVRERSTVSDRSALRLFVDFENVFGQHVLHPRIDLRVQQRR